MNTLVDTVNTIQFNYIDFTKLSIDQILFNNFVKYHPADPIYDESKNLDKMKETIQ